MSEPIDIAPDALAELIRPHFATGLLTFDVDGVLAPLVDHADDSRLLPGIHDALTTIAEETTVAIVSGRALESLDRLFAFPESICVLGSHGLEERGTEPPELDDGERHRFQELERIGARGVDVAGPGAWLEYKPASVVLQTRMADPELAERAASETAELAAEVDGAKVTPGQNVVELLARTASKGTALLDLADRLDRSPIIFFGDDITDEDAFRVMGDEDISVRVGGRESAATYRLDGPDAVAELLGLLSA